MVASSVHRLIAGSTRTTVARAAALISTNTKGSARPLWPCPLPFLVWPMVPPRDVSPGLSDLACTSQAELNKKASRPLVYPMRG